MTASLCPECGNPLPPDAPQGVCPRCLLAAGYDSLPPAATEPSPVKPVPHEAMTRSYAGQARFQPLSVEELQAKVPNYEIQELIGQGGMGAVYKARQKGLGRLVAIKVLPGEISGSPDFVERFMREARALAMLSHPHIVAVHDFGQAAGICYFVMEYVDGVNLRQALQAGKMDARQALAIVPQICDALQFAHDEGVVHRDIKPENILIDKRGRVKIADFGLAKLLGPDSSGLTLTGTQQVMGTLRYMAPEQMSGAKEVDHRADIFSLGVVFYELLTGELPIGRFAPPSKKAAIDARLDEVVFRALEAEPALRYQQVSEMKTGVEAARQPPTSQTVPVAQPNSAPTPARSDALNPIDEPRVRDDRFWGTPVSLAICLVLSFCLLALVLYTARPILAMAFGPDTELLGLGRQWGLGDTVDKVMASLTLVFVALGSATAWIWWKYQSAAPRPNRPRRHESTGTGAVPEPGLSNPALHEPRFSRAAIGGAVLIPVFLLSLILLAATTTALVVPVSVSDSRGPQAATHPSWLLTIVLIPLLLVEVLGLLTPVLTTVLGVVAIGNIRHSRGKLYGMPLAVFDALLYPLFLLDAILLGLGFLLFAGILELIIRRSGESITALGPLLLAGLLILPLVIVLDIWLVRLTWQAATRNMPGEESATKPRKDSMEPRFQRQASSGWSAAVLILILAAIGIIPLLLCGGVLGAYWLTPVSSPSRETQETQMVPVDAHSADIEMIQLPVSRRSQSPQEER